MQGGDEGGHDGVVGAGEGFCAGGVVALDLGVDGEGGGDLGKEEACFRGGEKGRC